uniref:Uncharacterized protein n=1 Tax=Meloidogyne javanica TaxID=6303 RepID=A0A915LW10_MELJA
MSSNDEIKEDKYLNKQQNLADYNSSSFSFDDEEEEKSANYGKSHNFVSDDVVQEDDLPGDVNVSVTPYSQQELPYTENNSVYASKRLSSEFDQELELLENEVENEAKSYVEKMENEEKNYATVEKAENEEIEKYEAEKKIEEDQKYPPPPQTPPPALTVANLVAKFNAVATTSDEKSGGQNGVNAKLKQDISGASIKINELRQRFNDDK